MPMTGRETDDDSAKSPRITLVVPTRNRAFTLRVVAPSYFEQELVDEIIFVDDAGNDDTAELIRRLSQHYPAIDVKIVKNPCRLGASQCRNVGVREARNDLILFCDDDEYLQHGYAKTCLDKLNQHRAGAVSGRRVYMQPGETPQSALRRFGNGMRRTAPFRYLICEMTNGAQFDGDLALPFTNAVILTRKELLIRYPFDSFYARGNGYREETDYQMNLFLHDHRIYITNETHSIHLPLAEVRTGGQRGSKLKRIYWSIFYTNYFFNKYYGAYARRVGLRSPRPVAIAAFGAFSVYRELIRPTLYAWAMRARALTTF